MKMIAISIGAVAGLIALVSPLGLMNHSQAAIWFIGLTLFLLSRHYSLKMEDEDRLNWILDNYDMDKVEQMAEDLMEYMKEDNEHVFLSDFWTTKDRPYSPDQVQDLITISQKFHKAVDLAKKVSTQRLYTRALKRAMKKEDE